MDVETNGASIIHNNHDKLFEPTPALADSPLPIDNTGALSSTFSSIHTKDTTESSSSEKTSSESLHSPPSSTTWFGSWLWASRTTANSTPQLHAKLKSDSLHSSSSESIIENSHEKCDSQETLVSSERAENELIESNDAASPTPSTILEESMNLPPRLSLPTSVSTVSLPEKSISTKPRSASASSSSFIPSWFSTPTAAPKSPIIRPQSAASLSSPPSLSNIHEHSLSAQREKTIVQRHDTKFSVMTSSDSSSAFPPTGSYSESSHSFLLDAFNASNNNASTQSKPPKPSQTSIPPPSISQTSTPKSPTHTPSSSETPSPSTDTPGHSEPPSPSAYITPPSAPTTSVPTPSTSIPPDSIPEPPPTSLPTITTTIIPPSVQVPSPTSMVPPASASSPSVFPPGYILPILEFPPPFSPYSKTIGFHRSYSFSSPLSSFTPSPVPSATNLLPDGNAINELSGQSEGKSELTPPKLGAVTESAGSWWMQRLLSNVQYYLGKTEQSKKLNGTDSESSPSATMSAPTAQEQGSAKFVKRLMDHFHRQPPHPLANVKKIVVIGVHGWFPTKWIQMVVGEPTGTSSKFCSMMTTALQQFFTTHLADHVPLDHPLPEIISIPLDGGGTILTRKRMLSKLLEPHYRTIIEADWVFVATHSQGTPVSFLLLEELLDIGVVTPWGDISSSSSSSSSNESTNDPSILNYKIFEPNLQRRPQKVGVLTMAGISHGPFPWLKSNFVVKYFEQEAARELFEFCEHDSTVAQEYLRALSRSLKEGVRVATVGSWFDQVVPLHSATMHSLTHPNLHRSVYIAQTDYRNDFLTQLVQFALKLTNKGLDDLGLITHLSDLVAGSLYTGTQGHSNLYEDLGVYEVVIKWLAYEELSRPTTNTNNGTALSIAQNPSLSRQSSWKTSLGGLLHPSSANKSLYRKPSSTVLEMSESSSTLVNTPNQSSTASLYDPVATTTVTLYTKPEYQKQQAQQQQTQTSFWRWILSFFVPVFFFTDPTTDIPDSTQPTQHTQSHERKESTPPKPIIVKQAPIIQPWTSAPKQNPYYLPFIMAKLLSSPTIAQDKHLEMDLKKLVRDFGEWNPKERGLRDLKYRLEPLKSHL